MNYKKIVLALTVFFIAISYSHAQTEKVKAVGEYAKIDSQKDVLSSLKSDDPNTIKKAVKSILAAPNKYNPVVLYAVSARLFQQEKKDEAVFLYYVAQLRARYDSNLCLDKSAGQAASQLASMFGQKINPYAFEDLKKLETTVNNVVAFVKNNEEDYDHRWINLHGMAAMTKSLAEKEGKSGEMSEDAAMTKPKNEWPAIKQETINTYYKGFQEALAGFKKQNK